MSCSAIADGHHGVEDALRDRRAVIRRARRRSSSGARRCGRASGSGPCSVSVAAGGRLNVAVGVERARRRSCRPCRTSRSGRPSSGRASCDRRATLSSASTAAIESSKSMIVVIAASRRCRRCRPDRPCRSGGRGRSRISMMQAVVPEQHDARRRLAPVVADEARSVLQADRAVFAATRARRP